MIETGCGFFHAKFHRDGCIMSPMQDKKMHINQILNFCGYKPPLCGLVM